MEDEACPHCGDVEGSWQVREYDSDEDLYLYKCDECGHSERIENDDEVWK